MTFVFAFVESSQAETRVAPRAVPRVAPRQGIAPPRASAQPQQQPGAAIPNEKIAVEQYQQQYWKTGREREKSVIQYKLYPRAGKWQLGLQYGFGSGDPFLSIRSIGGYIGYNFSEFWAINALYNKWSTSFSSAHSAFVTAAGVGTNSNPLKSFMGLESSWNLLYGKLSLLGAGIIHFDLMASLGAGIMDTDNNKGMTGFFGVSQQFYLSKQFSLKVDYRGFMFREKLIEKVGTTVPLGTELSTSFSWVHSVVFGGVVMF